MLLAEAIALCRSAGIPDWAYVADGGLGTGECVGIEPLPGGGWSIYYSERGRKSPLESHPDEDSACRAFLRHMNRTMRESGRPGIPGF
jgi:hypothetical protein